MQPAHALIDPRNRLVRQLGEQAVERRGVLGGVAEDLVVVDRPAGLGADAAGDVGPPGADLAADGDGGRQRQQRPRRPRPVALKTVPRRFPDGNVVAQELLCSVHTSSRYSLREKTHMPISVNTTAAPTSTPSAVHPLTGAYTVSESGSRSIALVASNIKERK